MRRHRFDLLSNLSKDTRAPRIRRVQNAGSVHQLLDRDGRMIDLSLRNQIIQHLRRSILHLIDVDAGVEQESLPANQVYIDERKLVVTSPRQRLFRIESCPTSRCVEIELRHLEAELQLWIDLASRLLECVRKVVFKRHCRQCELDQVRVSLDARLPLGLLDQCLAHPTANPAAFLAQQAGSLCRLHDRIEPRFADHKRARLDLVSNDLRSPAAALGQADS
jgi:hypothetical protein